MNAERERTAVHEAGHVVTRWLLQGRPPDEVTVEPTDHYAGLTQYRRLAAEPPVEFPDPLPPGFPVVGFDERSRRKAEIALVSALGGVAAEDVYLPVRTADSRDVAEVFEDWGDYPNDASQAREMARQQASGSETELIAYARALARTLLRTPVAVALMAALVPALLAAGTLSGPDVRQLLRAAQRDHEMRTEERGGSEDAEKAE